MARSKAVVETAHGGRYLQQLCKHWSHKFLVDFTPRQGRIDLGEGRSVTMSADDAALTVAVEAADIERMQKVVEDHIIRFAFRETLAFDWQPA